MLQNNVALLASLPCFVIGYFGLASFCHTTKQRAWILTALSSGLMSMAAIPYLYDFIVSGGQVRALRPATTWSDTVVGVFQGYLVADLLVGYLFYRQYIALVTGWIHHASYFALIQYVSSVGWSNIFCLALIMEVPTLLLALGSIHPKLRSDYLFASVFFATRIVLHITLIAAYALVYLGKTSSVTQISDFGTVKLDADSQEFDLLARVGEAQSARFSKSIVSPLPTLLFLTAFPMHCIWFTGCLRGIVRRRIKADKPVVLVSAFRARFQTIRGRLRLDQEARDRLRARVQAAYGNARERVWRRDVWARRVVGAYVAAAVDTQDS